MRKILIILSFAIFLSSCASTYYYSTIASDDKEIIKMHNGDFLIDNDTISITYSFNGYNVPIWISILNKLDKPLLIDWKKSFLIVEDLATSYSKTGGSFEGFSHSYGSTYHTSSGWSFSESAGFTKGNINLPEDMTFIPPHTKTQYEGMRIDNINYKGITESHPFQEVYVNNKKDIPKSAQGIDFDINNSPLRFRSYLTAYVEGAPDKSVVYDQSFFISKLIKTKYSPESLSSRFAQRGDITFKIEPYQLNALHYIAATAGLIGSVFLFVELVGPDMDSSMDKPSWAP